MSGITATVFGSTGFLGRYVTAALARQGTRVICPYRCDDLDMQHLKVMGDLGQVVTLPDFSARDDAAIRSAVSQSNVVINLIGTERETLRFRFEEVHVDIAERIAQAAADSGVCDRFIHTSCLGASADSPSRRLRTKAEGEERVRSIIPGTTILRPAAMVGIEDYLFNPLVGLLKSLPLVPLVGGGDAKMQPVYVRDVTEAFMEVLKTKDSIGQTYSLAGPRVFTRQQMLELAYDTVRENYRGVYFPPSLALLLAKPREYLLAKGIPFPAMTMFTEDAIREAMVDCILDPLGSKGKRQQLGFADLGVTPQRIDIGLPIEHMRHYRVGGYDNGTTSGLETGREATPASS